MCPSEDVSFRDVSLSFRDVVKLLETQYNSASEILYQLKLINITFRRITPYCRAIEQLAKYERMYQQQESFFI